jgi:hypothetical protein
VEERSFYRKIASFVQHIAMSTARQDSLTIDIANQTSLAAHVANGESCLAKDNTLYLPF